MPLFHVIVLLFFIHGTVSQLTPDLSGYSELLNETFTTGTEVMFFVNNPLCYSAPASTTLADLRAAGYSAGMDTDTISISNGFDIESVVDAGNMYKASALKAFVSMTLGFPTNGAKGTMVLIGVNRRIGPLNASNLFIALWGAARRTLAIAASEMKSVLMINVNNVKCKPLMQESMDRRKFTRPPEGKSVEFKQGEREFYVLMGCPNGKAVGYMLFQNRQVLGRKTVRTMKNWGSLGGIDGEAGDVFSLEYLIEDFPS